RPGGTGGIPTDYSQDKIGLALFDLSSDIGETMDVKDDYPGVLKKMQALADNMRTDLGDSLTKVDGVGLRAPGKL
ncbi:MAG TPA: arylsulfatase, partial [Verrucomicrobiales bacterium]|nr:arylsulfatase [Verrucomicrobiales bacterium]